MTRTGRTRVWLVIGQLLGAGAMLVFGAASCSRGERVLGEAFSGDGDGGPVFVEPVEASLDGSAQLTSYCPSSRCPAGYTTCPTSYFRCDVNVLSDRENCGACGVACPPDTERETFACVEGKCVMHCNQLPLAFDCDGVVDNGCETDPGTNDNCAACGDKCLDPGRPCLDLSPTATKFQCGCDPGQLYCENAFPPCVDPKTNDYNCGACGHRCDSVEDAGVPPTNAYFGCEDSQCNQPKCKPGWANCDDDMSNGCETNLYSADDCGSCGKVCPAGTQCTGDPDGRPMCACPPGQTYCVSSCFDGLCSGECVDLASDMHNCGACGFSCLDMFATKTFPVCSFGTCSVRCSQGRADCNGNSGDQCEVDTNSDPKNCGGCGITCDLSSGQACVEGRCVVEPCSEDAGGGTAR